MSKENMKNIFQNKRIIFAAAGIIVAAIAVVLAILLTGNGECYRVIKVAEVEGTSTVTRKGAGTFDAFKDLILTNGDRAATSSDGRLYLSLDSDKYVSVEPDSVVELKLTGREEDNNTKTKIVLESGSVSSIIENPLGENETYEVETPSGTMAVRGTEFVVKSFEGENGEYSEIEVTKGTVEVYRPKKKSAGSVTVGAGMALTVRKSDKDLTALAPYPIGGSAPIVATSNEVNHYEFGFDPSMFTFEKMPVSETAFYHLIDLYDVHGPAIEGTPIQAQSPDGNVYLQDDGIFISTDGVGWNRVFSIYDYGYDLVCDNSYQPQQLLERFNAPIMPGDSKQKVYDYFQAEKILSEGGSFTCNWSDATYAIEESSFDGGTSLTIRDCSISESRGALIRFSFDGDTLRCWSTYSYDRTH